MYLPVEHNTSVLSVVGTPPLVLSAHFFPFHKAIFLLSNSKMDCWITPYIETNLHVYDRAFPDA